VQAYPLLANSSEAYQSMLRKKFIFALLALLLPFSLAITAQGQSPQEKTTTQKTTVNNLIGTLKNAKVINDCGCSLHNINSYILYTDLDEKEGYINLDGKDVKLKLVSKVDYKGKPRVGKKFSRKYTARDVTVLVEYVITSVCDPKDESCEFINHSGTITATKDFRIQKMAKLPGGCGC